MISQFTPALTPWEIDVTKTFMYLLALDRKRYFNSDDFRNYGLHEAMADPAHEIGGLFAKWKWNRISETYGEKPSSIDSNNRRRVDLMAFNMRRWQAYLKEHLIVEAKNSEEKSQ